MPETETSVTYPLPEASVIDAVRKAMSRVIIGGFNGATRILYMNELLEELLDKLFSDQTPPENRTAIALTWETFKIAGIVGVELGPKELTALQMQLNELLADVPTDGFIPMTTQLTHNMLQAIRMTFSRHVEDGAYVDLLVQHDLLDGLVVPLLARALPMSERLALIDRLIEATVEVARRMHVQISAQGILELRTRLEEYLLGKRR